MATTVKETIKVKQLSKYGVQLENGDYVNWSKQINESEKGKVVPGGTYDVEMYRADSGKGYINSVVANGNVSPAIVAPIFKDTPVVKPMKACVHTLTEFSKKLSGEMTRSDWDAKDRRISRQGCIQVAVQVESDFAKAAALAEKMLEFVSK